MSPALRSSGIAAYSASAVLPPAVAHAVRVGHGHAPLLRIGRSRRRRSATGRGMRDGRPLDDPGSRGDGRIPVECDDAVRGSASPDDGVAGGTVYDGDQADHRRRRRLLRGAQDDGRGARGGVSGCVDPRDFGGLRANGLDRARRLVARRSGSGVPRRSRTGVVRYESSGSDPSGRSDERDALEVARGSWPRQATAIDPAPPSCLAAALRPPPTAHSAENAVTVA